MSRLARKLPTILLAICAAISAISALVAIGASLGLHGQPLQQTFYTATVIIAATIVSAVTAFTFAIATLLPHTRPRSMPGHSPQSRNTSRPTAHPATTRSN